MDVTILCIMDSTMQRQPFSRNYFSCKEYSDIFLKNSFLLVFADAL